MRLALTLTLLAACDPTSIPHTYYVPTVDMAEPPLSEVCFNPGINRLTPEVGYWATSGCKAHCLPPHQMFSICTERGAKYLISTTFIPQKYGAVWNTKFLGCPERPYRVFELAQISWPSDVVEGKSTATNIDFDCSVFPKDYVGYFSKQNGLAYVPGNEVFLADIS